MIVSLSADAIVEAECTGRGLLPWMWVLIDAESAAVISRSEPMFKTRMAALKVGNQVLLSRHGRADKPILSLV